MHRRGRGPVRKRTAYGFLPYMRTTLIVLPECSAGTFKVSACRAVALWKNGWDWRLGVYSIRRLPWTASRPPANAGNSIAWAKFLLQCTVARLYHAYKWLKEPREVDMRLAPRLRHYLVAGWSCSFWNAWPEDEGTTVRRKVGIQRYSVTPRKYWILGNSARDQVSHHFVSSSASTLRILFAFQHCPLLPKLGRKIRSAAVTFTPAMLTKVWTELGNSICKLLSLGYKGVTIRRTKINFAAHSASFFKDIVLNSSTFHVFTMCRVNFVRNATIHVVTIWIFFFNWI